MGHHKYSQRELAGLRKVEKVEKKEKSRDSRL